MQVLFGTVQIAVGWAITQDCTTLSIHRISGPPIQVNGGDATGKLHVRMWGEEIQLEVIGTGRIEVHGTRLSISRCIQWSEDYDWCLIGGLDTAPLYSVEVQAGKWGRVHFQGHR